MLQYYWILFTVLIMNAFDKDQKADSRVVAENKKQSDHPESNQGPTDFSIILQSDALPLSYDRCFFLENCYFKKYQALFIQHDLFFDYSVSIIIIRTCHSLII